MVLAGTGHPDAGSLAKHFELERKAVKVEWLENDVIDAAEQ
jgi:hypothetical protein